MNVLSVLNTSQKHVLYKVEHPAVFALEILENKFLLTCFR